MPDVRSAVRWEQTPGYALDVPLAQVRTDSETLMMPVAELEEELRRGRLAPTVRVQHPDWSGDGFVVASEVPALREALSSAEARLSARLWAPWSSCASYVTVGLCVLLAGVGVLQGLSSPEGYAGVRHSAVGFERTILDGGYWTPFSAALAHVGVGHLAVNLPLLTYCSYRTERLLGAWGAASVLAWALLCSTLAILAWSDLPVVGASTLAYGAWGAQIALGFRYGRWIPAHLKSRYGIGNLVLFLPLAFISLFNGPGVSLAGHAGGLAGGVFAVLIVGLFAPMRAGMTTFAALGLTALLPWTPPAWWAGAWSQVSISDSAHIAIPSRWREHTGRWQSFPAWSSGDRYPVFAGTFFASEEPAGALEGSATERERAVWGDWLRGHAVVTRRPGSGAGSGGAPGDIFDVRVETTGEPWIVVERVLDHDGLRTRAGYVLPGECSAPDACVGRRSIGDAMLSTLEAPTVPSNPTGK